MSASLPELVGLEGCNHSLTSAFLSANRQQAEMIMRNVLLWLLGVPVSVLILLNLTGVL